MISFKYNPLSIDGYCLIFSKAQGSAVNGHTYASLSNITTFNGAKYFQFSQFSMLTQKEGIRSFEIINIMYTNEEHLNSQMSIFFTVPGM